MLGRAAGNMCSGKLSTVTGILLISLISGPVGAETTAEGPKLSGHLGLVSEYVFRGTSVSNEDPAVQAGLEWGWQGWSVSLWGSEVDFDSDARAEVDLEVSWRHEMMRDLDFSLGVVRYNYISESQINYNDYFAGLSYKRVSFRLFWTPDFGGSERQGVYADLQYEFQLSPGFNLEVHAGYNDFTRASGQDSYWDGSLALLFLYGKVEFGLTGWFTDLEGEPLADERLVGSVILRFE